MTRTHCAIPAATGIVIFGCGRCAVRLPCGADMRARPPPLNVEVRTPRLTLAGATDELLERLVPTVRAGVADAEPWPFDDPISFYADSPDREWRWLRGVWAGRARVDPSF